jgi:hypothetical protein
VIDNDHVVVGEAVATSCFENPVDRDVTGLDGNASLGAILHQSGQFEELSEFDVSGHRDSRVLGGRIRHRLILANKM